MVDYLSLSISLCTLAIVLFEIWLQHFRRGRLKCEIISSEFTLPKDGWSTLTVEVAFWNESRTVATVHSASLCVLGLPPHKFQEGHGLHFISENGEKTRHFPLRAGDQVVVWSKVRIPWINQKCYVRYLLVGSLKIYKSPSERLYLETIDHESPFSKLIWKSEEDD